MFLMKLHYILILHGLKELLNVIARTNRVVETDEFVERKIGLFNSVSLGNARIKTNWIWKP